MDCVSCQGKIETAFGELDTVTAVRASTADQLACVETQGAPPNVAAFQRALVDHAAYKVVDVERGKACPLDAKAPVIRRVLWRDIDGIDAAVISDGEPIEFEDHLVKGKVTLFDFGADWCGPCRIAEKRFREALATDDKLAVRAVVLQGSNPQESFQTPVAKQRLSNVAGLPYFVVYNAAGKVVYRGSNVDKALQNVDKWTSR